MYLWSLLDDFSDDFSENISENFSDYFLNHFSDDFWDLFFGFFDSLDNNIQSCFYSASFWSKYFWSCFIQEGFSLDLIHQVKKIIACNRRCTRFSDVRRLVQCLVLTYICWINGRDTFIFHVTKKNERKNWKSCNKNQARTIWDNNLFELYILGFTRFLVCCPRRSSKIHFYSLIFFGSVLKNLPH